jgi:ribonucleoside-diphosphate reductase alpha chain
VSKLIGRVVTKIRKRDGRIVDFDKEKITNAIFKAAVSVGGHDRNLASKLADKVVELSNKQFDGTVIPTVEQLQDIVEKVLIEEGHAKTAKAYILYRQKRAQIREMKALMGVEDELKLSINAIQVLKKRYLMKDRDGKIVETPGQLFRRVAKNIVEAEKDYGTSHEEMRKLEEDFYQMMANLEFVPNSPTLMNAGRELQQLSACFVLPVEDNMTSIFDAVKYTALIHQSGGGTGFSFSRLRPKGDIVKSTMGIASGPLSFMKVFNTATEVVKQGGTRRGANMGILRVDHPDILDFIVSKEREGSLNNFNISVAITDKFMEAVENDTDYDLVSPRNGEPVKKLNARRVFNLIITMAWKNGEPGVILIDKINKANPTPKIGLIESTNPCGEQPLLPYESCNLGSINLVKMVREIDGRHEINWEKIRRIVRLSVRFLDDVVDMNKYPLPQIEKMTKGNRKIGLGVMGFADMLIKLRIPYNSDDSVAVGDEIMHFINKEGHKMSQELAEKRGNFPNWKDSIFAENDVKMRNATVTTIAPTGTISIIANASSGIEPLFAVSYIRKGVLDGQTELLEVNPVFEDIARKRGFYSEELMKKVAMHGSIQGTEEIPEDVRKVFVTAHDISPEWHVMMQAIFQKHTDNAVSKTVNFPFDATTNDVEKVYVLSYKLGCKGITIYRDKSREIQVLNIASEPSKATEEVYQSQPQPSMLKIDAEYAGGCETCHL